MLQIAKELNLPETAFLHKNDSGYNLRWFTPKTEIELCGHATLAAAYILWETRDPAQDERASFDFVSRFFAPAIGIDEDPVTGSAHCCLGPYWESRLKKSDFVAFQFSERGGVIKVRVKTNSSYFEWSCGNSNKWRDIIQVI